MKVDFGRTAEDYARHRQGFPPRFFEILEARGVVHPDDRVVDLGTGTGTLPHRVFAVLARKPGSRPATPPSGP